VHLTVAWRYPKNTERSEVVWESSRTVVTASVKEDEEAKVTLPQASCISLSRGTAL
jgi:hypothetical protein